MFTKGSNSAPRGVSTRTTHARSLRTLVRWGAAALFSCVVVLSWPGSAEATWHRTHTWYYDDGTWDEKWYNDETGEKVIVYGIEEDGTYTGVIRDVSNPNPEDPSHHMKGDYDSAVQLAKQNNEIKGIVGDLEYNFDRTPVGKHRTGKGEGLGPVYNPAGGDSSGASTQPRTLVEPPELEGDGDLVDGMDGWFEPNGDSAAGQFKNHGKKHRDSDGDDDDGSSDPTNGDGPFGFL